MEPSILLVDDEENVLRSLKRVLKRAGFKQVALATSGQEALAYLKVHDVSVIITDYRMPKMTGADLLRETKKHWPDIINIVLSGRADFNSVVELLNQGLAIKFLQKPWGEGELVDTIKQAQRLYCKRIAQHERDQLLLGSVTALIEINEEGKITRFNAPAQTIYPGLYSYVDDYIINIDAQPNKDDLTAFLSNKTNMLFIARKCAESEKEYEFILERYWSDDFCQLLKLSVNPSKSSNKFLIESFGDFLIKEPAFYQQLNEYEGENTSYTVIFIGIAKFELIADLLDYQSAYEFTHLLAKVLHNTFGEKVRMCQKHSNQFMLSVPHASNDATLLAALNKTMTLFTEAIPQRYKGMSLELYGVYGIFPDDVLSGKELINHLSLNMNYLAKKQQRFFTRFDAELVNDYRKNFELSRLLFKAIDNEEFSLCFQPKIDLKTHKVSGAEVLIRWYEPTKYGWVSPSLFIPISECDGQIIAISRFVISQSFKQLKQWNMQKVEVGKLAINLSARQIKEDPEWIDFMLESLNENNLSASNIQFELTETYLMDDLTKCQLQITRLRSLGFEVQIDDFGIGYSSLAYLSKLSIDGIKLDKELISGLDSSLEMQSMIRNIVRMSHDLNLKVIAEGVETAHECKLAERLGCDYIQGFYFSRPLPADEFYDYLINTNVRGDE